MRERGRKRERALKVCVWEREQAERFILSKIDIYTWYHCAICSLHPILVISYGCHTSYQFGMVLLNSFSLLYNTKEEYMMKQSDFTEENEHCHKRSACMK